MTFAEFLATHPPETEPVWVSDCIRVRAGLASVPELVAPDIRIHCPYPDCDGVRTFYSDFSNFLSVDASLEFLTYLCRDCRDTVKIFALQFFSADESTVRVKKIGESPVFGPPIPPRLIGLVGEDRELFLKGRRAELRGLGIGAFAYYRRVVEQQKGRIIREIGKVAAKLNANPETLKRFADAETETQFTNAIAKVGAAFPERLFVGGQNPLTLLHDALSNGLHKHTDEECLEIAQDIRLVLTDLAENISTVLKDQAEVRGAVSRLMSIKSNPAKNS